MGKKGFSLMEVMVVVVIVGILASVAIPSYTRYVNRTRRAEAITALQTVALYQEKARAESGSYQSEANLVNNYGLRPRTGNDYTPSEYYDINITDVTATTFRAYAIGKGRQATDKRSRSDAYNLIFAIDQDGTEGWATASGGAITPDKDLWNSLR
ncbi:MAG: type IV pilin protein [Desulfomonilia bacterium]|jgi:type IV pilus assembly protein PilE